MGLITDILSFVRGGGETDTLLGVQTALAKLQEERNTATDAIASAGQRRKSLLLQDATDKAIASLEREVDGHHLTLERLELIEGDLLDRASVLRSAERQKQIKKYLDRYFVAATNYIAAHRSAARAINGVTSIVDEARAAGFESDFMAHIVPIPQMLDLSQIAVYEADLERVAESVAGRERVAIPSAPVPRRSQAVAKPATAGTPRRVFEGERAPTAERKPRALFADGPKAGHRLLCVSRAGYETPDGRSCTVGDVVALPADTAKAAVANGVGEYGEASA